MEFEIGEKYTSKNSDGKPFLIQITKKYPEINRYKYKVLKGNTGICRLEFDDGSVFAKSLKPYEDLPHICYVLGGEETPLKCGEEFKADGHIGKYRIHEEIVEWYKKDYKGCEWVPANVYDIFEFINYPEKIIRSPQFSDDEEALMRLLVKNGLPYVARDKNKALFAYPAKPVMGIDNGQFYCPDDLAQMPNKLFPYITFGNSPFDAKAYLESEAKNDG
ncbi:MAG: hypothetical protein M0R51_12315 [Clostridia bacterium]|jgi:hypothetical protein|nr:hypothetical protein [Clostridia bacterium]